MENARHDCCRERQSGQPLAERNVDTPIDYGPEAIFIREALTSLPRRRLKGNAPVRCGNGRRYEFKRNNQKRGIELWEEALAIFEKLGAEKEVERMTQRPA